MYFQQLTKKLGKTIVRAFSDKKLILFIFIVTFGCVITESYRLAIFFYLGIFLGICAAVLEQEINALINPSNTQKDESN